MLAVLETQRITESFCGAKVLGVVVAEFDRANSDQEKLLGAALGVAG